VLTFAQTELCAFKHAVRGTLCLYESALSYKCVASHVVS
jgi:hypothetical protein